MKAITPVLLPAGNYSVVAFGYGNDGSGGLEINGNSGQASPPATAGNDSAGALTLHDGSNNYPLRYDFNAGLDFPTSTASFPGQPGFAAGTFAYTASAVPEPASSALAVGIGLLGVGVVARRLRRA